MSTEDRLRDLLREQAATVVTSGGGLARIQARIAHRRRWRLWVLPSAALVTAVAATSFFLLAPGAGHRTQVLQPGATSTPTGQPVPLRTDSWTGPAIWPFTSQSEADAWNAQTMPWADDSLALTRHFVTDYLGLTGVTVTQACVSCEVLGLEVGGRTVGEVQVAHYSSRGRHLFTVVSVGGTDLTVTSPVTGAQVTSPTSVTGRVTGVDQNVALRLLASDGRTVASASAPAGSAVPWSATLTWTASDWGTGGIVGVTRSARDGSVTRVVAVPVVRSTSPSSAAFVGVVDGHVALFDAATGKRLRQLTYPPSGTTDVSATWSEGRLVWVRTHGASVCVDELNRLESGNATTLEKSTTSHLLSPQLSPSGALLAWVDAPCDGRTQHVVVSGGGSPDRRLGVPHDARVLDVRDDGTLLVWEFNPAVTGGNVVIVPPGSGTLTGAPAIVPEGVACGVGPAAAFDGDHVDVIETCGTEGRLARYADSGTRQGTDPLVAGLADAMALTVRDGHVLVVLGTSAIARYDGGAITTLIPNEGCPSTGCVSRPDW